MSEMNEYEKLMYKKENDKAIGKALLVVTIILVLVVTFVYMGVKGLFIYPEVIKDTVNKGFSAGEPYPPVNGILDHGNGWVVVTANASDMEDGLIKLRRTYTKLSKKIATKKVDKIMVAVYEYSGLEWGLTSPYKEGDILFASNIWVKDLKSTNWNNIETYEEFKRKANIE